MAVPFVQLKAEQSTSSVSSFTSSAMTVAGGNAIVACMSASTVSLSSLVASDSKSNPYSLAVFKAGSSSGATVSIYVAPTIAGGSTTYTVTPSSSCFVSISAQEYSGIRPTSPGEATNSAGPTSSTAVNPGAVSPASLGDLYVACWSHDGSANQAFTFNVSGEGWNQRSNLTNTTNMPLGSQDLVSSGSRTGSATLASSAQWVAAVATFKMVPSAVGAHARPFPFRPGSPPSRNPPYR